jgi:exopolysaccharide biosynthesis protein
MLNIMPLLVWITALLCLACPAPGAWELGAPVRIDGPAPLEIARLRATKGSSSAELHIVRFPAQSHSLAVMDNPEGAFTLASAAEKRGALAAVNGGYFHADRRPLGLVIRDGKELHGQERAKLLSGVVSVRDGRVALQRVAAFKPGPAVREALQAGPFLIDDGKPVAGLNATRAAARTVVFTDGKGGAGLLICRFTTLAETAEILASPGLLPSGQIERALNLDGGSSTGLWVRSEPALYIREHRDVRNYLAIVPRGK